MTRVAPDLASQVRLDLARLVAKRDEVDRLLAALAEMRDQEALAAAPRVVESLFGLRSVGELASRKGEERDELLRITTDDESARAGVLRWVEAARLPTVFRALSRVLPFSFRAALSAKMAERLRRQREAVDQPVWPGVPVTLSQVFVSQRATAREGSSSRPIPNICASLEETLRAATSPWLEVAVRGVAGVGKSSLALMIAARYAAEWGYVPLLVTPAELRLLTGKATERAPFFEALKVDPDDAAELRVLGPVMLLVDGLDEVVASADEVREAIRGLSAALACSAVVTFSRDARVPRSSDASLQRYTIGPFTDEQVREWAQHWTAASGRAFDGERFLKIDAGAADEGHAKGIEHFARSPLMLALLASIEFLSGKRLQTPKTERGRAAIFKRLLDHLAPTSRQVTPHLDARRLMRAIAYVVRENGGIVEPDEVVDSITSLYDVRPSLATSAALNAAITETFERFPLLRESDGSVRFVHASLRDDLVAELLAQRAAWMFETDAVPDHVAVSSWIDTFGRFPIDESLLGSLRQMLPDWHAYSNAGRRKDTTEGRLRAVLRRVYRAIIEDDTAEQVIAVARSLGMRPRRVSAVALFNVFALSSCVREGSAPALEPEVEVPGSFVTAWHMIAAESDLLPNAQAMVAPLVSLRGAHARSIMGLLNAPFSFEDVDLTSADLRGLRLTGGHLHALKLDGARFDEASLNSVCLTDCSLRGATFKGAWLDRVNLRGADLRDADFSGANCWNVVLIDAKLDGAIFDTPMLTGCIRDEGALRAVGLDYAFGPHHDANR